MENTHFRNHFKMGPKMTGIRIRKINRSSSAYNILKKDDILLAIDGVPIENDETGNTSIYNFVQYVFICE